MQIKDEAVPPSGRNDIFWPETGPVGKLRTMANLDGAVRSACSDLVFEKHGGSYSSVYANAWRGVHATIDPVCSRVWDIPNITRPMIQTVLKFRFGCLWTSKRAALFGMPYCGKAVQYTPAGRARCPLCPGEDSGSHLLGGCQHPVLHKVYIARHNRAVQLIRQALSKGSLADCPMYMEACRQDELPEGVVGTGRGLSQLLKHAPLTPDSPENPSTSKPDLVVLQGVSTQAWQTFQGHP